ncbi:MAG TPA: photosystem II reaction center PsbP family protein [Oscillatoriaceae cyanobacterium M33_DOE_052]|uniref:Photosystem II oxygen evolving complex protein PsbP n=1 Tax=Planktothricoides sp. SpSt-374 TaxID=2282167 RepID=A0A7C3VS57_9CYAN|nr:photosystem II reaction center PsbP family protein [Oscillatoriaceae cyanobacterium M33_DOE_052]
MLKRIAAIILLVLTVTVTSCAASATAGLQPYVDSYKGYQFLYPNGWTQVNAGKGPDVVFHDLINQMDNVSVVISPVPNGKTLAELGTPSEVGYKLSKNAIAPAGSGREAELLSAESLEKGDKSYYIFEYDVKLANDVHRHNLASVAVSRGKLFTLNLSTTENSWQKRAYQFNNVVKSFSVN